MRWGICTQEICFKNAFLQAVMGSGQALPIKRGAGIQQALFLDVARHVSAGHWVIDSAPSLLAPPSHLSFLPIPLLSSLLSSLPPPFLSSPHLLLSSPPFFPPSLPYLPTSPPSSTFPPLYAFPPPTVTSQVHIFPEGRVIQSGMLGIDPLATRTKEEMEVSHHPPPCEIPLENCLICLARAQGPKGRLKWGVGRLVAHSLRCPVIIPMYHSGMDEVLPDRNVWVEDPETGKKRYDVTPKSFVPRKGKTIEVQFGAVVMVKDLVDAHEERHGLLQKASFSSRNPHTHTQTHTQT